MRDHNVCVCVSLLAIPVQTLAILGQLLIAPVNSWLHQLAPGSPWAAAGSPLQHLAIRGDWDQDRTMYAWVAVLDPGFFFN